MRLINPVEYTDLLCMKSTKYIPAIGDWVRVKKGIYKGDIGRVSRTHSWGIQLHLIPRISYQKNDSLKRKSKAIVPEAKLFDPNELEENTFSKIITHSERIYEIGRLIFEYGIVRKTYDLHSISSPVDQIPWNHFIMFFSSSHPEILPESLPRPQEWLFVIGDNITVCSLAKKGKIAKIEGSCAEVETEEGLLRVSWYNIRKHFVIGDYVRITGGLNLNANGWVIKVGEDVAMIAEKIIEGESSSQSSEAINVSRYKS